jgi:hypothetical protein
LVGGERVEFVLNPFPWHGGQSLNEGKENKLIATKRRQKEFAIGWIMNQCSGTSKKVRVRMGSIRFGWIWIASLP